MRAGQPPEDGGLGTTTNHVESSSAHNIAQAGSIGSVHFHGVPDADLQPGLVSTIPPTELLTGPIYGRDELVDLLVEITLRATGSSVVLHGTAGGGKTAVALALADRLEWEHPRTRVWWIDASSESSLSAGLREAVYDADPHYRVDEVVRAWRGESSAPNVLKRALADAPGRWVIVLDGVDDRRLLTKWRAALQQSTGTVIITSRHGKAKVWDGVTEVREVGALGEAAAVKMLQAFAPASGTDAQARELACALGYLPLALRLAGSYLNAVPTFPTKAGLALPEDFEQYRSVFHERFGELDRLHEIGSGLRERELLSRTWELSLDLLEELGMPWARPLLRWLSCFDQAAIPCDLANFEILNLSPLFKGLTGMDVIHAFVFLTNFGLVEQVSVSDARSSAVTTNCWLLHPVIREANRHQPDLRRDLALYMRLAINTLDVYTCGLSSSDPAALSLWAALSPHCESVVDWIHRERATLPDPGDFELLGTKLTCVVARFAQLSGAYVRAENLYRHALAVRLRHLGEHHPEVLALRRHITLSRWDHYRTRQSITELMLLTDDARDALGEHDPFTIECQLDLALAQSHFVDTDTVIDDYREVVRLSRKLYGKTEMTGLSAQMNLVTELGRREDESCAPELLTLLTMIHEVEQSPGAAQQVPFRLERLRATVMHLLQNYRGWRDILVSDD
ncbi:hypothetical protein LFM09_41020 [Lentzea alba]|uniref:hypothetical protein n=1 Tax=Lentzea alba TaxID=2714351 RepID=UPI0039BF7432